MIPERAIKEWSEFLPWKSKEYIEQDLIICRALCALYNDEYLSEHLAFRGGTALNKIYLNPQPRYSEDIDLVQINAEPIKETAFSTQNLNTENIIRCYQEYIGFVVDNPPTQKEYMLNMEQKIEDKEFLGDMEMLLRPDESYNSQKAWELVKRELIEKL